ncbi:zinc_finger lsd1 subclass family protein [Hexamita inflata]|uniref:Zinc finger lsd1 subclass family protein n=1 Tax=Hexamita inflata TaxID=28002 RepID=A0AA86U8E3_9EUKA|nr:zinc finger lsd1 subclass family protein [Hexamita inflata]
MPSQFRPQRGQIIVRDLHVPIWPGKLYSAINTCACQVSSGFGGADNSFCEDCKRSGKEASNTGCTACTGTQVLQSGTCQECPAGSVQSADKLSCVIQSTCSALYGPGSLEVTPGTCRCTASGFAGSDNTVCVDCLRIGKVVSGTVGATTCAACSGTQVLQAGVCAECPTDFVASSDKLSCISCFQRYGDGSTYSTGSCICESAAGFAGSTNSTCTYCWILGLTVSGTSCASCTGTQVLQAGICSECPSNLVPSLDKLSCVSCSSKYGDGSTFLSSGSCRCSDSAGFAGSDNDFCVDCLRIGKFVSGAAGSTICASCSGTEVLQSGACAECPANFVPSADKLSCVTCMSLYGPGSSYSAINTCACQVSSGFGGADNSFCEDCKRSGKEASNTGCTACTGTQVLQSGTCQECPAGSVQSADKLSCVIQSTCAALYGPGSLEVTPGTCRCTASGFAGSDNTVCVDCLRIGKVVSGTVGATTCAACSGTQVLQAGVCAECPTDFVASSDKLSCISCFQRYGDGSTYSTGSCICESAAGFAGSTNSTCTYCWILGLTVSGTSCASCTGTQVLQAGICSECPSNLVPSLDKLSCVSCSSKYGDGSAFLSSGICRCSDSAGFAGSDNDFCTDCWRAGMKINGPSGSTVCDQFSSVCGQGEVQNPISKVCGCDGTKGYAGVSGSCYCNNQVGYAVSGTQCELCWSLNKTALASGCQACGNGEKFEPTQNICICDQYSGFVGQVGKCKCDISLGFASKTSSSPLQCEDCWTQSKLALTTGCQSCANGEIFDTTLKSCVCDQALGFVGQVGKCSCNNLLGYSQILNSNPLECQNCWQLSQTSSQSQCSPCGLHEVFDTTSKTCVCDSSNGFVLTGGSCQCNANLGLMLLQGQSTCSCNPLTGHVTLAGGSCGCDSSSGLAGVTGACYCDYKKGFTGQPGKCYCNTALGFSPKMENGAIKSCECNANTGHLMLSDFVDGVSEKTCACNGQTGHAGEAGACYCDSATGNVGFPGSCFCNVNTFYIGKPGSCVNCGLKNAHPWQVGSDYVCQCNGVEGYGSPDASGVCKLCQSSNSVVKIDKDKQYQCVPCGPHQFVPDSNNTLCLCNTSLFYVETPVNNSCVCQPQYILGSKGCEKTGNSSRVTIIAISVPLVILIILIILIIALIKERKRRIKKHEIAEKQLKKMGPARLIVL